MKKLIMTVFALGFLAVPVQARHAESHLHDVTVKVDGLVCDFCAQSVKKLFSDRPEIEKVGVDLGAHEVTLDFKVGATLPDEDISKMIVDSGYTVSEIIR
jgi:copper chaperone CopZ